MFQQTDVFKNWIRLRDDPRQQLLYTREHPELITINRSLLRACWEQEYGDPPSAEDSTFVQNLFRMILRSGGDRQAIDDAYINRFSGYILPLPRWVLQNIIQIQRAIAAGEKAAMIAQHYRELIEKAQSTAEVPSVTIAEFYHKLGKELMNVTDALGLAQLQEEAIRAYKIAVNLYPRARHPDQYAVVHGDLAVAYLHRIHGGKRKNIERAISLSRSSLARFTHTHDQRSQAETLNNIGFCYSERIAGSRQTNLRAARAAFEKALLLTPSSLFPQEHARIQVNLGSLHEETQVGDPRHHIELAIACYDTAIQIMSAATEGDRQIWAAAQVNRGNAYRNRIAGQRNINIEEAIASYQKALTFYVREVYPRIWAIIQENLGLAYTARSEPKQWLNREKAIACLRRAVRVSKHYQLHEIHARILTNLGGGYLDRLCGDRLANLKQAVNYYEAAALTRTRETWPEKWAEIQTNLGQVYYEMMRLGEHIAPQQMLAYFSSALDILTINAFPLEHRQTQIRLGRAHGYLGDWENAWQAYHSALHAEDLLIQLGLGIAGRAAILAQETGAAEQGGLALARLGRPEAAILMIERGRARNLAEALAFDQAAPERIQEPQLQAEYRQARNALIAAQETLHKQLISMEDTAAHRAGELHAVDAFARAQEHLQNVIKTIQQHESLPDFFSSPLDAQAIHQACQNCGEGHAIVYITSSLWGGAAIIVFNHPEQGITYHTVFLPALTTKLVDRLMQLQIADTEPLIGGYLQAQEGDGYAVLRQLEEQHAHHTFRDLVNQFHEQCQGAKSTLDQAAQTMITVPAIAALLDIPFHQLSPGQVRQCLRVLDTAFMACELQRCLPVLAETILIPLTNWLDGQQEIHSITLIPCGRLAIFPLSAAPIAEQHTITDHFPTSYAPSLRALLPRESSLNERGGVYALGNPSPSPEDLWWGEMEAHTLVALGGEPGHIRVQRDANRTWLLQALHRGEVVEISTHASFDRGNIFHSGILLADGRWTFADMLSSAVQARGLRLAILSGCQTAVLDVRGARDEVFSLAVAMLQAGAKATLATLWQVDDRATYVFMTRFAQEWFPVRTHEPPAYALARTQRWMRTVTVAELQGWNISGPDLSFEVKEAMLQLHQEMEHLPNTQMACFADPYFWAGFHIEGW